MGHREGTGRRSRRSENPCPYWRYILITSASLKTALEVIFFGEDEDKYKFIIPIKGGFFVPSAAVNDNVSTWIGYRILEMVPRAHMFRTAGTVNKTMRVDFRVVALGPAAEDFITSMSLWEDRTDVKTAFEVAQEAQIMYDRRRIYTRPIQQEGFGDDLLWVSDMHAMTTLKRELTTTPWFPNDIGG